MSFLTISGLSKIYGNPSSGGGGVHPFSISMEKGQFLTLLGPSGCGKTTTLRCLAGLEEPDVGRICLGDEVFFDSDAGANVPLNRRRIGMVFQSYAVWPHMTVFQNVAFPLQVSRDKSYSRKQIHDRVMAALETVNLVGLENRPPNRLSGGQQQRVSLARAIVLQPKLLLLDEPLSNLDARLRDNMRRELKELQTKIGITTVYVTHDQAEALEMSDTIAVLNRGHVVQIGTSDEVYFAPRDEFVASFLGATNLLPATLESTAPSGARVQATLWSGQSVACVVPHAIGKGCLNSISVRPEDIVLCEPSSPLRENWNRVQGTIQSCSFLGSINRYLLHVGGLTIQADTKASARFPSGENVAVDFPVDLTLGLTASASNA